MDDHFCDVFLDSIASALSDYIKSSDNAYLVAWDFWKALTKPLSSLGRSNFLGVLAALTPWLEALATPDDLAAIAQSIVDVSRCWP
jgi:hypothetical protein